MKRTFKEVPSFTKKWHSLGFTDEDLRALEYIDIEVKECIYFLNVYVKNEQLDLTKEEKRMLKKLVLLLKEE